MNAAATRVLLGPEAPPTIRHIRVELRPHAKAITARSDRRRKFAPNGLMRDWSSEVGLKRLKPTWSYDVLC
jgi:hypothetical protein